MRRMISDTLQKYLKQVKETYPDPTDIGGSNYTAGTGIDITNNEISIDNTVALKSELFSGDYDDLTDKPDLTNYYHLNNNIQYGRYTTFINEKGIEYSKEYDDNNITIVTDYSGTEQWLSGKAAIIIKNPGDRKVEIADNISVFNSQTTGANLQGDRVEIVENNNDSSSFQAGKLVYTQFGNT